MTCTHNNFSEEVVKTSFWINKTMGVSVKRTDDGNKKDRILVDIDEKMRSLALWRQNLVPPEVGIFDEPNRCYVLNNEWAKIVMGLVSWLAETPVWRDANDEGYYAIEQILEFMIGSECMSFELRQNEENPCILEQSLDGGETWSTAFDYSLCQSQSIATDALQTMIDQLADLIDTYDSTVGSIAPDMVYDTTATDDIRDIALCHALNELVDVMCELELQYRNEIAFASDVTAVILGLVGIAITVASLGTATPFYLGVAAALAGGFGTLFGGLSVAILGDETARDEVVCCMYAALSGSTITQSNFEDSLDLCGFDEFSNESQLAGAIAQMLTQDNMYISFVDYMQRAFKLASLGIADCPCDDSGIWEYTFNFTVSDGSFLERSQGWTGEQANYSPGNGWSYGDAIVTGTDYRRVCSINRTFTESVLTEVSMIYNYTKGFVTNNYTSRNVVMRNGGVNQANIPVLINDLSDGSGIEVTLTSLETCDEIALFLSCSNRTIASYSGDILITSCTIKGIGTNPFT